MKFKYKPIVIDAEQYKPGMEDGFEERFYNPKKPNITYGIPTDEEYENVNVPYITTQDGKFLIRNGEWIITNDDGKKHICAPDIFDKKYELVE